MLTGSRDRRNCGREAAKNGSESGSCLHAFSRSGTILIGYICGAGAPDGKSDSEKNTARDGGIFCTGPRLHESNL